MKQNVHRGLQSPRNNRHLLNLLLEKEGYLLSHNTDFDDRPSEFSFLKISEVKTYLLLNIYILGKLIDIVHHV